jgi:hypothetical protein
MHKTGWDNNGYIFQHMGRQGKKASAILIRMTNDVFKTWLPTKKNKRGHFYWSSYSPEDTQYRGPSSPTTP